MLKHARRIAIAVSAVIGAALVVATLTVGGAAMAANTVRSSDIVNQTIQSWDIATAGVGKAEVRPNAVGASEVRDRAISGDELDVKVEIDGFYTTTDLSPNAGAPIPAGAEWEVRTAKCADGKVAIGGGFSGSGGSAEDTGGPGTTLVPKASYASGLEPIEGDPQGSVTATSWSVAFANTGSADQVGRVWVVCADLN